MMKKARAGQIIRGAAALTMAFILMGQTQTVRAEEVWDVIFDTSEQAAETAAPAEAIPAEAVPAETLPASEGTDPAAVSAANTMYQAVLNDHAATIRSYSWQFPAKPVNLCDVNGDGIPELFYLEGTPEGQTFTANLHIGTITDGQYAEPAYFPAGGGLFQHLSPGGGYHCFALTTGPDGSLLVFSAEGDADYAYEIWQIGSPLSGQAQVLQHVAYCDWRQEWSLNDAPCTKEEAEAAAGNLYAAAGEMILYSKVEVFNDQGLLNKSGQCGAGTLDEISVRLKQGTAGEGASAVTGADAQASGGQSGSLYEEQLRSALAPSGQDMGRLQYFLCDDYDGDGRMEAYALFCDLTGSLEIANFARDFQIWFVSSDGTLTDMNAQIADDDQRGYLSNGGFVYVPGTYDMGGAAPGSAASSVLGVIGSHKFLTIECYYMGSGGTSYIFGVKNGQPYEPQISGHTDFFGIVNGVATGTAHDFSAGYHQYLTVTYQLDETTGELTEISRTSSF